MRKYREVFQGNAEEPPPLDTITFWSVEDFLWYMQYIANEDWDYELGANPYDGGGKMDCSRGVGYAIDKCSHGIGVVPMYSSYEFYSGQTDSIHYIEKARGPRFVIDTSSLQDGDVVMFYGYHTEHQKYEGHVGFYCQGSFWYMSQGQNDWYQKTGFDIFNNYWTSHYAGGGTIAIFRYREWQTPD